MATKTDTLPDTAESRVTTAITRGAPVRAETLQIGITTVAALAFTVGAWQFNRMATALEVLGARLESIHTRLAVIESARLAEEVSALKAVSIRNTARLDAMESKGGQQR